jgi:hypothetical protein
MPISITFKQGAKIGSRRLNSDSYPIPFIRACSIRPTRRLKPSLSDSSGCKLRPWHRSFIAVHSRGMSDGTAEENDSTAKQQDTIVQVVRSCRNQSRKLHASPLQFAFIHDMSTVCVFIIWSCSMWCCGGIFMTL